jgi:hypothetical protein
MNKVIYYVDYKRSIDVKQHADLLGLDYQTNYIHSVREIPEGKIDLIIADHPQIKKRDMNELMDFAKKHPQIPIIVTRIKDFPDELTRSNTQHNMYSIRQENLIEKGVEKLLQ